VATLRPRNLAFALLTGASIANAGPQSPPLISTLVSSYTPGEQLCLEVTPDGRRGFVALGASIAMLDLESATATQPPRQFDQHQVPDCQPLALRYYHQSNPDADYLFIAGGALGVWRLSLCSGIVGDTPQACPPSSYADLQVQEPVEGGFFQRKRCVDVDVLETGSGPVLFALFAASSDAKDSFSPTELRAYSWKDAKFSQIAAHTFPSTIAPPPPAAAPPVEIGTALAVDPADHDSIYVGMGKGGIWRADLSGGSLSATQVWSPASCSGAHPIEHVRDLAIVRVETVPPQSVLYAALNYGELLEITDLGGSGACKRVNLASPGYAESIAAVANQGTDVRVVVAAQTAVGKGDDMRPPVSVNGVWAGLCLTGVGDPDDPGLAATSSRLQFYEHDFADAGALLEFRSAVLYDISVAELGSHTAILQPRAAAGDRLFHCSRNAGTELYDLDLGTGAAVPACPPFLGAAFRGQDSVVSALNPGVALFIQEGAGAVAPSEELVYIDPAPPFTITAVPRTQHSPCARGYPPSPGCSTIPGPIEPGLYQGSILDEAHWPDPAAPDREYFLPGRKNWQRYSPVTCQFLPDCGPPFDPCDANGNPAWNLGRPATTLTLWRLISLRLPLAGMPADGPSMQARTWLFDVPKAPMIPGVRPAELSTDTEDRVQSLPDARLSGGLPTVVYLSRSGSSYGVKALRTQQVVSTAVDYCASQPGGVGGNGELLPSASLPYRTTLTHLELEYNGTANGECRPITPCAAGGNPPTFAAGAHHLFNDHTELYKTRDQDGAPMTVLAVASGFPASFNGLGANPLNLPQTPSCQWMPYAGRPMLVLLDVTGTGDGVHFREPTVLRVALGTGQGNAFCVRTKIAGRRAYAYVGDIQGRIAVFDVSGDKLLPLPTLPYAALPTQFLAPLFELDLPRDPVDGLPANCVDMEIVGDYLYVALARLGLGILDISQPTRPQLIAVLDTPGLAMGLSQRTVPGGVQLIVGDSRCGIRVYQ
jgi:hypothetical protein